MTRIKPKLVYVVAIGSTVIFVTSNMKAAYLNLSHSIMYDDAASLKSYAQFTRIMKSEGEFIHRGEHIIKYTVKRLPLHTKHSKIGISA